MAQIITFTTMVSQAAIRDVGRVLEVPLRDIDLLAKLVPSTRGSKLDDALKEVPDFRKAYETKRGSRSSSMWRERSRACRAT